jgi:hypothetical protein
MRIGAWGRGRLALVVTLVAVGPAAPAQVTGYRWVDDGGAVHYAARRDQVPERYRSQLGPPRPGESPRLTPRPTGRAAVPHGCILRLRGNERQRGASYSYPDCDACRRARRALSDADARRAECFASSLEDELGKRRR